MLSLICSSLMFYVHRWIFYLVDMMLGAFMPTHISLLYAGVIAHVQDLYYSFDSHMVHTCRLF